MNKFSAIGLSLDAVLGLTSPGVFLPTDAQIKPHNVVTHRRAIAAGAKTDEPHCDKTVTAVTALRYMLVRPTTLAH